MPKNETFEQRPGGGEGISHDNIGRKNIVGKETTSAKFLRWELGALPKSRVQCPTTKRCLQLHFLSAFKKSPLI